MLALDPYYEMFPSSYQRPYPYWRRSFGTTEPITIAPAGLSTGTKIAIGIGAGAVVAGLGAFFFARRR